jgi:hypothetical protein
VIATLDPAIHLNDKGMPGLGPGMFVTSGTAIDRACLTTLTTTTG